MKRLLPLLALILLLPHRGVAETTLGTVIGSVPYTITKAGVYHFTKNLGYTSVGGDAIRIEATDVVIDLNGYELVSDVANSTASGIECTGENRVTIKNGTIRNFQIGLLFLTADYVHLENLLVTNSLEAGISIVGNHSNVSQNQISDTGNATSATATYAVGISLTGTYGTVTDNNLQHTFITDNTSHFADGIRLRGCSNIVVSNNRVLDVEPSSPTKGTSTGIAADSTDPSSNLVFLDNIVLMAALGIDLSGGTSGNYGDNITNDVGSGYNNSGTGMTVAGTNY
jgi:hypothetical protein